MSAQTLVLTTMLLPLIAILIARWAKQACLRAPVQMANVKGVKTGEHFYCLVKGVLFMLPKHVMFFTGVYFVLHNNTNGIPLIVLWISAVFMGMGMSKFTGFIIEMLFNAMLEKQNILVNNLMEKYIPDGELFCEKYEPEIDVLTFIIDVAKCGMYIYIALWLSYM